MAFESLEATRVSARNDSITYTRGHCLLGSMVERPLQRALSESVVEGYRRVRCRMRRWWRAGGYPHDNAGEWTFDGVESRYTENMRLAMALVLAR